MGLSSVSIRGWGFVSEFLDRPHTAVRLCFRVWNLCACCADSGPCAFSGRKVLRSPDCSCAFFTPPVSRDSAQRSKLQEGRRGAWNRGKWECLLFSCRLWIVESWNMIFLTMFGSHAPRVHQDCEICNLGICDLREDK